MNRCRILMNLKPKAVANTFESTQPSCAATDLCYVVATGTANKDLDRNDFSVFQAAAALNAYAQSHDSTSVTERNLRSQHSTSTLEKAA